MKSMLWPTLLSVVVAKGPILDGSAAGQSPGAGGAELPATAPLPAIATLPALGPLPPMAATPACGGAKVPACTPPDCPAGAIDPAM
ncbi:MAG TPA: hypothetical protein VHZ95_19995 [Polyangiales bacterium]|nr:hypothetical protein [Polyangiales bacterium]